MEQVDAPGMLATSQDLQKSYGLSDTDLDVVAHIAHNRLTSGDFDGAQRTYAVLVVLKPDEIGYQIGLADAAMLTGNADLSLQAAATIIAVAPTDPRGYFLSGRACLALDMMDEAREDLRDAIDRARKNHDAAMFAKADALLGRIGTG